MNRDASCDLVQRLIRAWFGPGMPLGKLLVRAMDEYALASAIRLDGITDATILEMVDGHIKERKMADEFTGRYKSRLADVCEVLHMAGNGSADPLTPDVEAELVAFLRSRLAAWTRPLLGWEAYDNAWRTLVVVTLEEDERRRAQR